MTKTLWFFFYVQKSKIYRLLVMLKQWSIFLIFLTFLSIFVLICLAFVLLFLRDTQKISRADKGCGWYTVQGGALILDRRGRGNKINVYKIINVEIGTGYEIEFISDDVFNLTECTSNGVLWWLEPRRASVTWVHWFLHQVLHHIDASPRKVHTFFDWFVSLSNN